MITDRYYLYLWLILESLDTGGSRMETVGAAKLFRYYHTVTCYTNEQSSSYFSTYELG